MILISMLSEVREGFLEEGCSNWFGRGKGRDRLRAFQAKGRASGSMEKHGMLQALQEVRCGWGGWYWGGLGDTWKPRLGLE